MSGLVPPDPPSHPAPSLRPRPSLPPRAAAASPPPTPPTPPHPAPPPPPPPTPPLRPASSPDPCFVRSADLGDGDGFLGRPRATFHRLDAVAVREEESRFKKAAAEGCNLLPLKRCIFSDHLTPVLAYRCLVREDDREAPSFLFESVEQGSEGTNVGRYSVIGAQPAMEIVAKANHVTVMDHEMKSRKEQFAPDPMTIPRSIMEQRNPQIADGLPDAFCGGWVGFFSYDTVNYVETKKLPFSKAPQDDRNLPDIHLGLYNDIVVFDHVEKKTHVVHWVRVDCYHSVDEAYEDGKNRLEALLSRLHSLNVTIVNRPLAGTIRRGKTKAEDKVLEQLLLSDEKQCAEHIMLVDLGWNDVGKRGSNQAAETPTIVSDEDVLSVLMEQHDLFLSSTRSRLTKLQTVHQMWERNDVKGVIAAMDKMSDHAVSADMASVLMEKSETITLDLCTSLLPVLTDLLESKTDRHLGVSLELLVKFVRTFGPVINSTVSAGPSSVGVDL